MRWLKKVDVSSEKNRWLISLAYVALLIMLTYLLLPVRFETNDDGGLREIIAGYRTPEPYPKTVFTYIWSICLHALSYVSNGSMVYNRFLGLAVCFFLLHL